MSSAQAEAASLLVELRAAEEAQGTQRETVAALEAALKEARERGAAAVAQLAAERESAATLEKARAAAVQVKFSVFLSVLLTNDYSLSQSRMLCACFCSVCEALCVYICVAFEEQ